MFDLKEEDQKEFQKVVAGYKRFDNELNFFLEQLPILLKKYKENYQLTQLTLLKGGRLGLIFNAYSNKLDKNIVIKIIPDFLKIFEIEANAYSNLSKEYMCPIIELNEQDNIIIMEKLDNKNPLNYKTNKLETKIFFDNVYNTLSQNNKIDNNHYMNIYKNYHTQLKEKEKRKDIENIINTGYKKYEQNFQNDTNYLLHGDLHTNNILKYKDTYYAIDPLGYVAPIEFTFARFIITELFFTECTEEYLEELLEFITHKEDPIKILNAIYIDAVLFLEALIIQINNYQPILPKVLNIIKLIEKTIKNKEMKENENSYNITKTRKCFFRS